MNAWLPQCKIEVGLDISPQNRANVRIAEFDYKIEFFKDLINQKVKTFDQLVVTCKVPNL